jgi:hypothetical protein
MICGKDKRDDAKQADERDECEFGCGLHLGLRVCRCEAIEREQDLTKAKHLKNQRADPGKKKNNRKNRQSHQPFVILNGVKDLTQAR